MTINWDDVRVGDIQLLRDGRRKKILSFDLLRGRLCPVQINDWWYFIDGTRRTQITRDDDIMAICHPGDEVSLLSAKERSEIWDKMEEHNICLQEALEVTDPRRKWRAYTNGGAFYYGATRLEAVFRCVEQLGVEGAADAVPPGDVEVD